MARSLLVTLLVFAALCAALVFWQPALLNIPRVIMLVRDEPVLPYPVPVEGVRTRQLTDQWGAPRSGGRKHQGIDIFARCGTPIVSATRGLVTRVGTNMLGGRIVRVLGPGGYWHYYAHLSEFGDIREGQLITAGTVLGKVGDTGNAKGTPCHLHYGIYSRVGGAKNPYPLLTAPVADSAPPAGPPPRPSRRAAR